MDEFALIRQYFDWHDLTHPAFALGVGDDAAVLNLNGQLAVSSDMLIADQHFPATTRAYAIGYKALAVNLSDLAAMGATPLGFTLSLGLPTADLAWLAEFSKGLHALAAKHQCALIGGDTVRAPVLSIAITVMGTLPEGRCIRRDKARAGDQLCVSGPIGDAALGLKLVLEPNQIPKGLSEQHRQYLQQRLDQPEPCVSQGQAALSWVQAGLDVSDGLLQDAGHLAKASKVAVVIEPDLIPRSRAVDAWLAARPDDFALLDRGGDDYQLLFAVAKADLPQLLELGFTRIGFVSDDRPAGVYLAGSDQCVSDAGFKHFGQLEKPS